MLTYLSLWSIHLSNFADLLGVITIAIVKNKFHPRGITAINRGNGAYSSHGVANEQIMEKLCERAELVCGALSCRTGFAGQSSNYVMMLTLS